MQASFNALYLGGHLRVAVRRAEVIKLLNLAGVHSLSLYLTRNNPLVEEVSESFNFFFAMICFSHHKLNCMNELMKESCLCCLSIHA